MNDTINFNDIINESKEPFVQYFIERQNYPQESRQIFMDLYQRIQSNPSQSERIHSYIDIFIKEDDAVRAFEELDKLAQEMNVHTYTMSMLFLIMSGKTLFARYHHEGVAEDIYWDSTRDLYYKLLECYDLYGIWGTFVRGWYPGFYQMKLFALGRLEYELDTFQLDEYTIQGNTVKRGDKVINMHIPSSGSFSEDRRLDSYRRAYEFFKKEFDGKPIPMVCHSWLLYPEQVNFLPEKLNIRGFMNDFTYIQSEVNEEFEDGWRIFGKYYEKGIKEWPRDTVLRKAYAEHIEKGGKVGYGYGIFLFDGVKIIR